MVRDPSGQIGLKLRVGLWRSRDGVEGGHQEGVDDDRPRRCEFCDGLRKVHQDARIGHRRRKDLAQDAQADLTQAILLEIRLIAGWDVAGTAGGGGILGIRANDHLQQDGHIGDRAGHGGRRIADPIERDDPGAGHQAHRGTEPDQRIMRRWHAHRTARVRADAHDAEVRRQRRPVPPEEPPVA